jgi:hypothetical protein
VPRESNNCGVNCRAQGFRRVEWFYSEWRTKLPPFIAKQLRPIGWIPRAVNLGCDVFIGGCVDAEPGANQIADRMKRQASRDRSRSKRLNRGSPFAGSRFLLRSERDLIVASRIGRRSGDRRVSPR